jgi:hypothetical protein
METRKNTFCAVLFAFLALSGSAPAQWTEPVPVTEINTENLREWTPYLSFDGLCLYFAQGRGTSGRHLRIYQACREEPSGPFTSIMEVLRAGDDVYHPWVSPDGMRLYYIVEEGTDFVLRLSQRDSMYEPWPTGVQIPEINSLGWIESVSLTADELILVFSGRNIAGGQGGRDIWMASRPDTSLPFGNVVNLSELNTSSNDGSASVSPDGLTVFFASDRNGLGQIFTAARPSLDAPFGSPELLSVLDSPGSGNSQPALSSDGTALYFTRFYATERTDIWVSYLARLSVAVNIKPGACPNPVNPASRGVLPVAVLGSEDLDVNTIDIATIRLAGIAPIRSNYEDVATPVIDGNECECNTEGPDGYTDLTLKFGTQAIVEKLMNILGDLLAGDELVLTLTGSLADGTPIEGTDCVVIVGKVPRPLAAKIADINEDGVVDLFDFCMVAKYWLEPSAAGY